MKRNNGKANQPTSTFQDLGFGTRVTGADTRLINRDGNFNVRRTGLPFLRSLDSYDTLIRTSWMRFLLVVLLAYGVINCAFAGLYLLAGMENLRGAGGKDPIGKFWDAFFFSTQTFTTVGYGSISPDGFITNLIASSESMLGWFALALATGLLYGRFSRPQAKLLFSDRAIIAPYQDKTAFEFRIANARHTQLIEVEVQVMFTRLENQPDEPPIRKFYELSLERQKVTFLSLSWTIVHPVNEESPLYGVTPENLAKSNAEFLVLVKAFDDTFSQTVQARSSYHYQEIVWGAKFKPMHDNGQKGVTTLRLDQLHHLEEAALQPAHQVTT